MFNRFGLRFRMAVSYVAISALAVLAVEVAVVVIASPQATSSVSSMRKTDVSTTLAQAQVIASGDAKTLSLIAGTTLAHQRGLSDQALLAATAKLWSDQLGRADQLFPTLRGLEAVATPAGKVLLSSKATSPTLSALPASAVGVTPARGTATTTQGLLGWSSSPISIPGDGVWPAKGRHVIGLIYAQFTLPRDSVSTQVVRNSDLGTSVWAALLVLALLLPLGVVFGLLSTRHLIARIRRLAAGTASMAAGDLQARVSVSGSDEVSVLEAGFNQMVQKLDAAGRRERDAASAQARLAERTRITRELHDSISQDLFSLNLVSGNLQRTLPEGSRFREQADTMVRTIDHTMRDMRAMLLELRPVALDEDGLVLALRDLCRSYEVRLGIDVVTDIDEVHLDPVAEHTVLRVVQEALSNAARHAQARSIALSLRKDGDAVEVIVHDDGRGFDHDRVDDRHGLGLSMMRERVSELGGEVAVRSQPDEGTTIRVWIPGGRA